MGDKNIKSFSYLQEFPFETGYICEKIMFLTSYDVKTTPKQSNK